MSCCVESRLPCRVATASALHDSVVSVSCCSCGWTAEGYSLFIPSSKLNRYSSSRVGTRGGGARERRAAMVVVLSTHFSTTVLKSNRKSRYGKMLNPYDSHDDYEDMDEDEDQNYDWFPDDGFAELPEYDFNRKTVKPRKVTTKPQEDLERNEVSSSWDGKGKLRNKQLMEGKYPQLSEEIGGNVKWIPLLDYLSTFGLKDSDFIHMYGRHMLALQVNVCSAQERLEYLLSVGVKGSDVRRILLRQPQILQYTVENTKSHVAFLLDLGIPNSKVGQLISVVPSLLGYSIENSLKPTVRYLIDEVGINEINLCKVVQMSPHILVRSINSTWTARYLFLTEELGATENSVIKMVTKHPQLFHYSIDNGLLPRISFLRSIGLQNSEILELLTRLPQVFSLSLEDNLKPKYLYLVNELKHEVESLIKCPTYLSLSLDKRIRPRHRFLVTLRKVPKGRFPLSLLLPSDECFCKKFAGINLDQYLAFRRRLSLDDLAKKYNRRRANGQTT